MARKRRSKKTNINVTTETRMSNETQNTDTTEEQVEEALTTAELMQQAESAKEAPVEAEPEEEEAVEVPVEAEPEEEDPVEVEEPLVTKIEAFLQRYSEDMRPRVPVEHKVGASNQFALWKTIEGIINLEDTKEFKENWNLLLMYFVNEGAFTPAYIYRFAEYWQWNESDLSKFQKVVNILLLTADPAKRTDGLKQVDFDVALRENFTERAMTNITNFYRS